MLKTIGWKNVEARRRGSRRNLMCNIAHNNTAVSAEELGMVAADGRTKAKHHFKSGYSTAPWIVCRPNYSRMEPIASCCS